MHAPTIEREPGRRRPERRPIPRDDWQRSPSGLYLPPHAGEVVPAKAAGGALAAMPRRRTGGLPTSGLQVRLEPDVAYLWQDLGVTAVAADTDPIGRWQGRVSAHNFDRVATGNRPAYRTNQLSGGAGRCVSFDGVDDYLKSTSWQGVGGAQTIAFRFRLASLPTNRHLYWARTAGGVCDAVYFASSTRINCRLGASANGNGRNWSVSLDTTTAHTVVLTFDGVSSDADSSYVCRYDGVVLSFAAQSALTLAGTAGTSVIGSYITPTAYFPGFLGPFYIWNRVLTGTEIPQVETILGAWN